jgi:hypothetical protein
MLQTNMKKVDKEALFKSVGCKLVNILTFFSFVAKTKPGGRSLKEFL